MSMIKFLFLPALLLQDGKAMLTTDRFNYAETNVLNNTYGPADWNQVTCSDVDDCPGWPTNWEDLKPFIPYDGLDNMCLDCAPNSDSGHNCSRHKQTPIDLRRDVTAIRECKDRHRMNFVKGNCLFEEMNFEILPHVLRAYQPEHCSVLPNIDYSMGFPQPWHLAFTDVSVPSQHTIDGRRYDAELVLSHVYSRNVENRYIGNVAVLMERGDESDHYGLLELYIQTWLAKARSVRETCARRKLQEFDEPEEASYLRGESTGDKARSLQDDGPQVLDTEWYSGDFHPYLFYRKTRTEYYFRYEGSMPEPPCFEAVHWRVLKDPIKVAPSQIEALQDLLKNRIDPDTCENETAALVRTKATRQKLGACKHKDPSACGQPAQIKVDVSRPLQTTTNAHRLVFCECVDWESHSPFDKEWCELPMEERGVSALVPRG